MVGCMGGQMWADSSGWVGGAGATRVGEERTCLPQGQEQPANPCVNQGDVSHSLCLSGMLCDSASPGKLYMYRYDALMRVVV